MDAGVDGTTKLAHFYSALHTHVAVAQAVKNDPDDPSRPYDSTAVVDRQQRYLNRTLVINSMKHPWYICHGPDLILDPTIYTAIHMEASVMVQIAPNGSPASILNYARTKLGGETKHLRDANTGQEHMVTLEGTQAEDNGLWAHSTLRVRTIDSRERTQVCEIDHILLRWPYKEGDPVDAQTALNFLRVTQLIDNLVQNRADRGIATPPTPLGGTPGTPYYLLGILSIFDACFRKMKLLLPCDGLGLEDRPFPVLGPMSKEIRNNGVACELDTFVDQLADGVPLTSQVVGFISDVVNAIGSRSDLEDLTPNDTDGVAYAYKNVLGGEAFVHPFTSRR